MPFKSVKNKVMSNNLIDLNSPKDNQYAMGLLKPLIPETKLTFPLPPRESFGENNPFDKFYNEATKFNNNDDPFEIVSKKAKQYDNVSFESVSEKTKQCDNVPFEIVCEEPELNDHNLSNNVFLDDEDDANSSLGIIDDSVLSNDNLIHSPELKVTPDNLQILNSSLKQSAQDYVTQRINQINKSLNLDVKCSLSNSCLGISNPLSSISSGREAHSSSFNYNSYVTSTSVFGELSSENNFDKAFHEHLQRHPSSNLSSSIVNPLVGRKSLSARKPTNRELSGLERCRLMGFKSNIFNFKERLKLIDNLDEDEFQNIHFKKEDVSDSVLSDPRSLSALNCKISLNDPIQVEENEEILENSLPLNNIIKKFDKNLSFDRNISASSSQAARSDVNNESREKVKNKSISKHSNSKQDKKWKKDVIKFLENTIEILKNDNDEAVAVGFNENILINVAKTINEKQQQEEHLDSTASCDSSDDFIEVKQQEEVVVVLPKQQQQQQRLFTAPPPMRKSNSFTNVLRKPSVVGGTFESKLNPNDKSVQQPLNSLRPKHATSDVGRKGPLKAVIPVDIMTKDSTAVVKSSKMYGNVTKMKVIPSTPKTENISKIKPVAQSTPTNSTNSTNTKQNTHKSPSVGVSPISRFSSGCGNNNNYKRNKNDQSSSSDVDNSCKLSTKPPRKLTSVQSSSALINNNNNNNNKLKISTSQNMLMRRKSATELKLSGDKKLGGNVKHKVTTPLRPLNNLTTKLSSRSSISGGGSGGTGKENIRAN